MLTCDPRYRATVVAGGRTHESSACFVVPEPINCVLNTEDLEGVQPEALCFILRVNMPDARPNCEVREWLERRSCQLRVSRKIPGDSTILVVGEKATGRVITLDGRIEKCSQRRPNL